MSKLKHIFIISCMALIHTTTSFTQTLQEEQLANEYLNNEEYDKALPFFKKFHSNDPKNKPWYKNYVTCLINTEDLKTAEKVIKKQSRDFPRYISYKIDLGQFYRDYGDPKKAKKIFDKAIKDMPHYFNSVDELAGAFIKIGEVDYAIETLIKGRRNIGQIASFNYSLAELYSMKGEFDKMTDELIGVLKNDAYELEGLKSALLTILDDNPESTLNTKFREAVLKEIQKSPGNTSFADLYIWLMLNQKNYEAAFIQSKAIDKREKDGGLRVFQLSKICQENLAFEVAIKCYEFIMEFGTDGPFYFSAKKEYLSTKYLILTQGYNVDINEASKLEKDYINALEELKVYGNPILLQIELAHLQAFYLDKMDIAMNHLNEILDKGVGKPSELALVKLKLADILILQGDLWEPSLLYGQVEKDYKNDLLGQEAKFKNAKLSFYRGEFEWAQTQMSVLKTSTSKYLSNDAIALSMLILDNSGLDSTYDALSTYSRADLYYYQGQLEKSLLCLDTLEAGYTGHPVQDEVKYMQAEIAVKMGNYEKAVQLYEIVATTYGSDILADDALFKLGDIYENILNNTELAIKAYQQILKRHKDSIYVVEARKRFKVLVGDQIN